MNEDEIQKRIAELRQQFNELGVFSDDSSMREQGISLLSKEVQEGAQIFLKNAALARLLQDTLMADLRRTTEGLKKNKADQFWRRIAIRTLAATVDGVVYCLKELTYSSAGLTAFPLDNDESKFLLERKAKLQIGEKPKNAGFKDNLKRTFKLFAKVHGFECATDFGQDGFVALSDTFELRHGLMHPKSFMTFCVTDEQAKRAGKGEEWLSDEIQKLFDACNKKINSNVETILKKSSEI